MGRWGPPKPQAEATRPPTEPKFREPSLAEINIKAAIQNTQRLEQEEKRLKESLRRSAASLPALLESVSRPSGAMLLPPLR
jgi:hypothetical protein